MSTVHEMQQSIIFERFKTEVHWNSHEVINQVNKAAQKGLKAAAIFLASRMKEAVSVPAPRGAWKSGTSYGWGMHKTTNSYIALIKHGQPGMPPRKLSGRLRQTITWEVSSSGDTARVGTNLKVGRYSLGLLLEKGWTARAGTWVPFIPSGLAEIISNRRRTKGSSARVKPGEIRWVKRKTSKQIGPFPFLVPTLLHFSPALSNVFQMSSGV